MLGDKHPQDTFLKEYGEKAWNGQRGTVWDSSLSEKDFAFLQGGKDMIAGQRTETGLWEFPLQQTGHRQVWLRERCQELVSPWLRKKLVLVHLRPWEWLEALGCP